MDDDLKLVKEVLNGNIDSFNILVNKYEGVIVRFIYNILKDKEASEDITQEVFISVYNKMYTFNKEYKFSNWIFQIARNKCIDYMRKYKRVYEANMEELENTVSKEISPEQSAEFSEVKRQIKKFINTLSETDRYIIFLKYSKDNTTFSDIAQILNMTESSVKKRYYKTRDKFKEYTLSPEKGCK